MKKYLLYLLFILLMGMTSMSVQAKEITKIKTYSVEKKRLDNIHGITADLRYMDLNIKPSKDQYVYLSYQLHCKDKKNPFIYSVKDHILNLKEEKWEGISWQKVSANEWKKYTKKYKEYMKNTITLYIPSKNLLTKSTINMKDGNLLIKNISCDYMKLNIKFGDIDIKNAIVGTANIQINDGMIQAKDIKAYEAVTMTTKYGDIHCSDCQFKKGLDIKTQDGDLNLKHTNISRAVSMTAKYGNIHTLHCQVGEEIKIKTSDGDVSIKNTKALDEINVSSNYGNIDISDLMTPKNIQVDTQDGDIVFKTTKKQLKQRNIIMDTQDGSLSVPAKLSDGKQQKKDGWHYQRNSVSGKTLLKITTHYGNISLKQ